MAGSQFEYVMDIFRVTGECCRSFRLTPDWLPAYESARFLSLKSGWEESSYGGVLPRWSAESGAPHVAGVRAFVIGDRGVETAADIPITYFGASAQRFATALVESAVLADGERYTYGVRAYPVANPESAISGAGELPAGRSLRFKVRPRDISELRRVVTTTLGSEIESLDYPVFVPDTVLQEADELKEKAKELETGGILIGFLCQDPSTHEPFAEITALIPARHTLAESTKLTFTPDTWMDVHAAISLRNKGESFIGWFHTHGSRYWCTCCDDPEKLEKCPWNTQFFSADDCSVHRTVFSGPHNVAIVLGDRYERSRGWITVVSAYGWQNGVIQPREISVTSQSEFEQTQQGDRYAQAVNV